ncbi:MAG: WecB/TagA/CpsF family glycosyltransferase [Chloroflexota bacterium]|nr:WecB/TagA/CpsF family glycosyltransferase [Chloroflexota bacterium]
MLTPARILVVQLADIGDLVLSTPALAALRDAHPNVHITLLTTRHAAPIVQYSALVNNILTFDKHTFDSPKALLKPANLRQALLLARRLHAGRYDTTLIFHHFSTRLGALKFAALAWSAGSKRIIGLDNGNGFFLTERIADEGFGARHQTQYWLDLAALTGASSAPRPAVVGWSEADAAWARAALGRLNADKPIIAIHAGSGGYSSARRWDAVKFAAVADALAQQHGAQIVLVGGKGDDSAAVRAAMRHSALDLTERTTLHQLAALLAHCDLFIGADSGVMHIAAAVGTPVVAIFGPSNAAAWSPWTPQGKSVVVRSAPECSPCSYVGTGVGLRNGCAARTCMRMVGVREVVKAAAQVLSSEFSVLSTGEDEIVPRSAFVVPSVANPERRTHHLSLLGLPIDAVTYDDWLRLIGEWVAAGDRCHHVCTMNPEFVMIAQQDVNFRNILQRADLRVPDGVGLLWAARRRGRPLPQRVTGSDGVPIIAAAAAQQGWRLFLLGAAEGVADKAAAALRRQHPTLQVVGTYSGSPAPQDEDRLVEIVNASGADILFVAFGAPEQDKWIARNLPRLKPKMAMGVGGTFDFIAGIVPRAPLWMQRLGLEWLFRLYLQPWRIGRMLRLPRFVLAVLLERR